MDRFPDRVTLFEDGVFRWAYDMDMWHNRYILRLSIAVTALLLGIPTLFLLAMVLRQALPLIRQGASRDEIMFFLRGDLTALAVVAGLLVGLALLIVIIYAIVAAAKGGRARMRYEMSEEALRLVRSAAEDRTLNAVSTVASVASLFAGDSGGALGATGAATAAGSATTRFEAVRRVKSLPKNDLLELRMLFGMNQIFVPAEDHEFVRSFMLAHIPPKAKARSERA